MKTKFFIVLFLAVMVVCLDGNAQLRKIAGLKGAEGRLGYTGAGFAMSSMYSKYVSGGNYYKIGGEYAYELLDNFFVNTILLNANFNFRVFDLGNNFYVHLNGGAVVGYEMIEENEFILSSNSFVYGPTLGGEIEYYITDKLVLVAGGEQRYLFGSTIGDFNYRLSGGLKFIF